MSTSNGATMGSGNTWKIWRARSTSARFYSTKTRRKDRAAAALEGGGGPPAVAVGEGVAVWRGDFEAMGEGLEILVTAHSRLLNDISHELRSPLARLNVALGLARQRANTESATMLDRIELEASRLNELIGRLLTLARLADGEQIVPQTPQAMDYTGPSV